MKITILAAIGIFSFLFLKTSLLEAQNKNNFVYELSTTKTEFFEGETIPLFMRVKNNSNKKDSIYSFGYFKIHYNLFIYKENGDSSLGFQFVSDDGSSYTVFQPGEVIEFYIRDLTFYRPLSGGFFYTYIPVGNYKVRGYIPSILGSFTFRNKHVISNTLEFTIKENEGKSKEEFERIKELKVLFDTTKSFDNFSFIDSLSKFVELNPNSKFITRVIGDIFSPITNDMDKYVDLSLIAIKKADFSDSTYARILTTRLLDYLWRYSEKISYTLNDFKFFIRYDTDINPIIREQLIREIDAK